MIVRRQTHPALLAVGGVLGGAAGLVGGAYIGARATEDQCEDCFLLGGIYGAVAGGSAGLQLLSSILIERSTSVRP